MWEHQIESVEQVDQRINSNFYPIDRSHFIRRTDIKLRVFNVVVISRISVSFNANEKSINYNIIFLYAYRVGKKGEMQSRFLDQAAKKSVL